MVDFPGKEHYDLRDLRQLVEVLRGEGGCPWDREQTHESLRRCMLEEAYEACGAIDEGDPLHLREELGDVLLQVIFHASLSAEEGTFDLDDVADAECQKLIYRHPHVFGDVRVSGSAQVLENWDVLKQAEKEQRSLSEVLEGVTPALPALWRAEKCLKKADKALGRSPDRQSALADLDGSLRALETAEPGTEAAEEAVGRLLFAAVTAAAALETDPEMALHRACGEMIGRVRQSESETQ